MEFGFGSGCDLPALAANAKVIRRSSRNSQDRSMTNESATVLYDQLYEIITRRMSIRDLRPDPVPDEYVEKILEAGRWAMSGANSQPWEFLVVRDPEVKRALAEAYTTDNNDFIFWMEQMRVPELRHPAFQVGGGDPEEQQARVKAGAKWAEAPVLLVILGDGRRQWGTVQGALSFGRHQSHFTDGLSNAAMLMHLAATSLGLASQHVTIHIQEPFKRILGVPDLLMVHHIVPIGFSAIDRRPTTRRPLKDMVHYDRYDVAKYMSNKDVVDFLYELRGKTMHAYHTTRKDNA
jgi:nitroreductase